MSKSTKKTGTGTTSAKTKAEPKAAKPAAKPTSNMPLVTAEGSEFTDLLGKATVEQLSEALAVKTLSAKKRSRIEATLKTRTTPRPADDIAKTVEAVEKGYLTKGVEIPMPVGRRAAKGRDTLAPVASGQASSTKDATTATDRPTGQRGGTVSKAAKAGGQMSGLDAAAKVLAESSTPLSAAQIIEQAAAKGYWTSPGGKTPAATIYAAMATEAKKKGAAARFVKVDRGQWTLTDTGKAVAK